jgi:hypothetical protein
MRKSLFKVMFDMYQGALANFLNVLDWNVWRIFVLEFEKDYSGQWKFVFHVQSRNKSIRMYFGWMQRSRNPRTYECKSRGWRLCWLHFLYVKRIIHHEFVPEKQSVNGIFYKEVNKKLNAPVHRGIPEFPGIFCTTMNRRILQALSPRFWRNEGSSC